MVIADVNSKCQTKELSIPVAGGMDTLKCFPYRVEVMSNLTRALDTM